MLMFLITKTFLDYELVVKQTVKILLIFCSGMEWIGVVTVKFKLSDLVLFSCILHIT